MKIQKEWITTLVFEQDVDEDIARAAIEEVIEDCLDEDGFIDDYEWFYQEAAEAARRMQDDKDRQSQE